MKIAGIMYKFLSAKEHGIFGLIPGGDGSPGINTYEQPTIFWSAKEAVFKWYGDGGVDFRKQIQLLKQHEENKTIDCFFSKTNSELTIHYHLFDQLVLAWVMS